MGEKEKKKNMEAEEQIMKEGREKRMLEVLRGRGRREIKQGGGKDMSICS